MQVNRSTVLHDGIDLRQQEPFDRSFQQRERCLDLLLLGRIDHLEMGDDEHDVVGCCSVKIVDLDIAVHAWMYPADARLPPVHHVVRSPLRFGCSYWLRDQSPPPEPT